MGTYLVSVILPNYNHARFLEERIESILNQTYSNIELIILDDNSLDDSREVISKYKNHPKVSCIVFNAQNSGSTFLQWHKGIELAKGDLIWIAESDDSCDSMLLEELVGEFRRDEKLVLSYSSSIVIDEKSEKKTVINRLPISAYHGSGIDFIRLFLSHRNVLFNASAVLFRKDVVATISTEYERYKGSGDWLFWIKICREGNVSYVRKPLNYFRKHGANVTTCCESNGIQQVEAKSIIDYMEAEKLISSTLAWKIRFDDLYEFKYDVPFVSENVKSKVFSVWKMSWKMNVLLCMRHWLHNIKKVCHG